jgi:hypothetical protein
MIPMRPVRNVAARDRVLESGIVMRRFCAALVFVAAAPASGSAAPEQDLAPCCGFDRLAGAMPSRFAVQAAILSDGCDSHRVNDAGATAATTNSPVPKPLR